MHKRSSCTLWSQTFSVFVRCFMSSHKRQKPGLERWLSHESALLCRGLKFCFHQSRRGACHGWDPSSRTHRALLASWPPHSCAHHTVHIVKDKQHLTNSIEAESLSLHTGMSRKDHWRI